MRTRVTPLYRKIDGKKYTSCSEGKHEKKGGRGDDMTYKIVYEVTRISESAGLQKCGHTHRSRKAAERCEGKLNRKWEKAKGRKQVATPWRARSFTTQK